MRFTRFTLGLSALVLCLPTLAHATRVRRGPTSARAIHSRRNTVKVAGQRQIDPSRATAIQTALVKAGYLQGTPSGQWDSQTAAALQKLQADNGWQTKVTPDARALIKLGLGPAAPGNAASVSAPGAANGDH
jgi:hypothetical protein